MTPRGCDREASRRDWTYTDLVKGVLEVNIGVYTVVLDAVELASNEGYRIVTFADEFVDANVVSTDEFVDGGVALEAKTMLL